MFSAILHTAISTTKESWLSDYINNLKFKYSLTFFCYLINQLKVENPVPNPILINLPRWEKRWILAKSDEVTMIAQNIGLLLLKNALIIQFQRKVM